MRAAPPHSFAATPPPPKAASCASDEGSLLYMLLFSCCSAALLLVNKVLMHAAPLPSFISTLQFAAATVVSLLVMVQGCAPVDRFVRRKVKPYAMYVCMFVATVYCSFKALEHSNVETLIIARSCVPCVVSVLEFFFLGRALPTLRSWVAMGVMIAGAVAYVATDQAFRLDGFSAYTWVALYFSIISVEMAYGKYIVGPHLGFASMWGPTLYTNTISIPLMVAIGIASKEPDELCRVTWSAKLIFLLMLSCILGVAISFLGFKTRSLVSATCYTVLGVANKILTVTGNLIIWDHHASALGIVSLCVCLCGASMYQQSPMRANAHLAVEASASRDENAGILMPAHFARGCPNESGTQEKVETDVEEYNEGGYHERGFCIASEEEDTSRRIPEESRT
ncbi:hypothetical protein AB1Y20_006489 [Prymnesium parvum]|uniref:Sugar phosphate transporter domain-containing protein n=1 Tax=Prymnesium parvum TaxID=97485 RepID=A0AB34J0C6_PRYPA